MVKYCKGTDQGIYSDLSDLYSMYNVVEYGAMYVKVERGLIHIF